LLPVCSKYQRGTVYLIQNGFRWFWKFGVKREEYGVDEKLYVIRKHMKLSQGHFDVSPTF
jgi:DnaJ family protein C protein 25